MGSKPLSDGYLEFYVQPPPEQWSEPYAPPRMFEVQFGDSLQGGHENLRQMAQKVAQTLPRVA